MRCFYLLMFFFSRCHNITTNASAHQQIKNNPTRIGNGVEENTINPMNISDNTINK